MATILYDDSAYLDDIKDKQIAVIGYGNQGRAQALNLRDSELSVIIGTRSLSKSKDLAIQDGFKPTSIEEASKLADIIVLTLPDELIPQVYEASIKGKTKDDVVFLFAHGFVVHYKTIELPSSADVVLVAPTGPGHQVRTLYQQGKGLPALIAVENNNSGKAKETCLAYAKAIGSTRAGVIETTFEEETVVDLFCEQSVLCGGMPELIKKSFETLVENGYQPELAYISCLKEVKLIADLLFTRGLSGMRGAISNTAKYGAAISGPEIIDSKTANTLQNVLNRIEDGSFAKAFVHDAKSDYPVSNLQITEEKNSKLDKTGTALKESLSF